jgi:5'-3' exonuclease
MLKINLVIDGNYVLYRSVFILDRLKTLYGDLETLLLRDYNKLSTVYPYDNIYFISDTKQSWRKQMYPEYKDGRKKDSKIDWEFVFETYDKFKENLKLRNNCMVHTIDPFEGDDIIAYVITESNKKGYSNFIISNDGDMHQFLDFDTTNDWINIMYNHKFNDEKVFTPKNHNIFFNHIEEKSEENIFELNNDSEFVGYLEQLKIRCTTVEVNKEESLFKKIVTGDKGDNILSVVKFDKTMRGIGKAGGETVWKMFKERYPDVIDFDSDVFVENLLEILTIYKKNKDEVWKEKVKKNIIFSRKLTRLESEYLPKGMLQILESKVYI